MSEAASATEVAQALRERGVDDVEVGRRRRAEYSSDASNYRVVPQAVVFPRSVDEIPAVLSTCRELGVPLTARGAGTSIAGNAIGAGVVLDFSRHLGSVLEVDPDARTARVQPGAVLDSISAAASAYGLRFGPNPSTHARATLGGTLGNNACGSRTLAYGRAADNVVELEVVTAAGRRFAARRHGREGLGAVGVPEVAALEAAVRDRLALVRTEFGRFPRQVSGYSLEHLLPERGADLAAFLSGTEGTLALTVGATVKLVRAPTATALAVVGYPDMATAADAVPALLEHPLSALEGLDHELVATVRRRRPSALPPLPRGGGWLFAETTGDSEAEASAAAAKVIADADGDDAVVLSGAAAAELWRIREDGAGLGGRTPAGRPAWPGWEDAAVPPERLGRYLRELLALMRDHRVEGLMYGHFGEGCIHARFDFPLKDRPGVLRAFVEDAADLVAGHGGSVSGEHGDGRARSELLPRMYSADAISTFAAVKHAFDPENLLNPGVVVNPAPLDADLRLPHAQTLDRRLGFRYPDDRDDLAEAVHRCVGVGKCRVERPAADTVMCPSYQATRDEKDSTRGRARVLQELAAGTLTAGWRSPELQESLDLCLACKGCASDCPAGVDMATYKAETLHQRYRGRPRPVSHYALGRLPQWLSVAARTPRLANRVLGSSVLGGGLKRLGGVDSRRPLPRLAEEGFRAWLADRPRAEGRAVLLWVDTFTEHFSPAVGQAAVAVLEDAGYDVQVTDEQVCCGLTWISTGQLGAARRRLHRALEALGPALAAGHLVVGLEPSCTAVLRDEVVRLLPDDPRSAVLASRTRTLAQQLRQTPGWRPPDLSHARGIAQPHCHQHAVLGWDDDRELLRDAGAGFEAVGGCCGLAGNFGMERGHYDVSVAVAGTALLPAVASLPPDGEILADGFSCRTQLDHLAGRPGRHLAQLLADQLPR